MVATDHSYDYVAQTFPGAISWQGPAGPPWAIGTLMGTGANVGLVPSGGSTQATINDKNLTSWLLLPQVGVTTAPQVSISGWLKPWSVQASVPTTTTSLVHGSVDWQPTGGAMMTSDLPLTSELTVNKCGRVVYSSYHTLSSVNAASLSAQERILEYLLLDAASCGHTAG